jgi:hypothetical protein
VKHSKDFIQTFDIHEKGFHPVLISDSWQVATLNYADELHIDHLKCLVKHQKSNRAVSLLEGNALLIYCDSKNGSDFRIVELKRGISYNIPRNVLYTITMYEGSQLFIVERPNTHIYDRTEYCLTDDQIISIKREVKTINHT